MADNFTPIRVPGLALNSSVPKPPADTFLTAGSLVLLDFTRSAWTPTVGSTIPNLAAEKAAALGIADASVVFQGTAGAKTWAAERTRRGGLHVAVAQSGATAGEVLQAWMSAQTQSYLLAHPNDPLYMSMWVRTTRPGAGSGSKSVARLTSVATGISAWAALLWNATGWLAGPGSTDARRIGYRPGATNTTDVQTPAIGASAAPSGLTGPARAFLSFGPETAGEVAQMPSLIVYRIGFENLKATDRTWQQAANADAFLYNLRAAELAADTWTPPAQLVGA